MIPALPSFLPGRLVLRPGHARDYHALERFHYRAGAPATFAAVYAIDYSAPHSRRPITVAAAVLSHPVLSLRARDVALNLRRRPPRQRFRFINANIRTISRVVVHPTFRSLGLAGALVRCLIQHCPTRYVEALAAMGRAHPLFERAGMRRFEPDEPGRPVYYLCDRLGA